MALAVSSSSWSQRSSNTIPILRDPLEPLVESIKNFEAGLTLQQRTRLRELKSVPDADAVISFTAELDAVGRSKRRHSVAVKLHAFLQSAGDFSKVIDTLASSKPEIVALVWGSVRFILLSAANFTSYFIEFAGLFNRFKIQFPRFDEYQTLFPTSHRLQAALGRFYASTIDCCKHMLSIIHRTLPRQILKSFWTSFDKEMKPFMTQLSERNVEVESEIRLAKAQADHQYQLLQVKERELANASLRDFTFWKRRQVEEIRAMRLHRERLEARKRKQELLDWLCVHNYGKPYREACKKRHLGTTEWMFSTPEFESWRRGTSTPALWCSGKIGSGKTILTASAVDRMVMLKKKNERVVYFFIEHSNSHSLQADTILRTLISQSIDHLTIPSSIEEKLKWMKAAETTNIENWTTLLREVARTFSSFFIFVDVIDECDIKEQRAILEQLSSLVSSTPQVKIFLSGREGLRPELNKKIGNLQQVSLELGKSDIDMLVEQVLHVQVEDGDLQVGDMALLDEIKTRLVEHADGMFVWVKYLIEELCLQFSDEDIRKALESLPKDLEETFNRALLRILSQNAKVAPRVFLCIAVATRHLSLIEILEAISIKVGEGSSSPARRINNKYSIIALCGNLLHVNEEDETVQFAHRSVFDYVTGAFSAPQLAGFHINMEQADHHAGELCVTYLLWSNFQTTLARRADNSTRLRPDAILSLVLGREGTMEKIARTFMRSRSTNSLPSTETYVVRSLEKYMVNESETAENMVEKGHPFLKYARKYWITHTAQFQRGISSMWEMWRGIVFHDLSNLNLDHVQRPAEFEHLDATSMWIWAQEHRYFALIRVLVDTRASDLGTAVQDLAPALIRSHDWEMSVAMLKQQDLEKLAFKLVEDGDWVVLDAMLDKMLKQWSLGDDFLRHILNAATNRAQHDERLKFINLWCPVVLYMTIFFVVGVVLRYRSSISETTCGYWIWFRMDKYVAKQ